MADKYVNATGVQAIKTWIQSKFADKDAFDTLSDRVDDIVAEGGEPNVIDTVKVNGTALTPVNKAVDVVVPVDTSDLVNDGDGQSPFATEEYVDQNGGKIDVIKVNGSTQTITNKAVDITVPTKVSDLTNDSSFQTDTEVATSITTALANNNDPYQTESDVQTAIDDALADVTGIDFEVVSELPATGEKGVIYLVEDGDLYDEYIWISHQGSEHFERIGSTSVDLSGYWSKEELVAMTVSEINAILNA